MIPTKDYDIVGSYNNQIYSPIDAERSINCFEYRDPLGKKPKALIGTSGLINTNYTFDGQPNNVGFRAEFIFNGTNYFVVGNGFYSITLTAFGGSLAKLGTIGTSAGYVKIDANTHQIMITDTVKGYIWDTTATSLGLVLITDPSFPPQPLDLAFLDGFFTVPQGSTPDFYLSSQNQGLIWGPDNNGTQTTFTMGAGSSNLSLTYHGGSIANYALGTSLTFSGGALPAEIVAGTTYYVKSIVNATTITISATPGGTTITSIAGGSGSLTNGGQLQKGSITSHPGTIVAMRTLHRRLFIFSQFYTEPWENAGIGTNLPFRRNNSLLMEYGTISAASVSVSFDIMIYMAQSRDGLGSVMMVSGTESVPISTNALNAQISQYAANGQLSDVSGFMLRDRNIIFYRMNFTSANHTFVYNVSMSDPSSDATKLWHEEETLSGNRHIAQTSAFFGGQNYVGHYNQPILYILDPNTFTNDGEAIRRARIPRPWVPEGYQRLRVDRLQIDLLQGNIANINTQFQSIDLLTESGENITTESGENIELEQVVATNNPNPLYLFLSISKDGGQYYGYKVKAPMGAVGQRTFRTLYRKLGTTKRGQSFQPMIEFFQPVPFVLMGASWAMEVLPE